MSKNFKKMVESEIGTPRGICLKNSNLDKIDWFSRTGWDVKI